MRRLLERLGFGKKKRPLRRPFPNLRHVIGFDALELRQMAGNVWSVADATPAETTPVDSPLQTQESLGTPVSELSVVSNDGFPPSTWEREDPFSIVARPLDKPLQLQPAPTPATFALQVSVNSGGDGFEASISLLDELASVSDFGQRPLFETGGSAGPAPTFAEPVTTPTTTGVSTPSQSSPMSVTNGSDELGALTTFVSLSGTSGGQQTLTTNSAPNQPLGPRFIPIDPAIYLPPGGGGQMMVSSSSGTLWVLDSNDGLVLSPTHTEFEFSQWSVDLRAQVVATGTTVQSISWDVSQAADATNVMGASTYRLQFSWLNTAASALV